MRFKRIISILLSASIISGVLPITASANTEEKDIQSVISQLENEFGNDVEYSEFNAEATQEPFSNEPIEYEEILPDSFEMPEEECNASEDNGIVRLADAAVMSTTSSSTYSAIWNEIFTNRFGDNYLSPYKKSEGETVCGNTNRLSITETDLKLAGKNGLDVEIRRTHDNQFYSDIYSSLKHTAPDYQTVYNRRYMCAFTNSKDNSTVYVGFMTKDDFYTYMENGLTISSLPTRYSTTYNDATLYYYNFEQIYAKKSSSGITLSYNSNIKPFYKNIRYSDASLYELISYPLLPNKNHVGGDWTIELPEASLYAYETDSSSSSSSKSYWYYYVGAFRDIDGGIYELDGYSKFVKPTSGNNTYKSSFNVTNNSYLSITPYFETQTLSGYDCEYNFVIFDSKKGLSYYMYDTGVTDTSIKITHRIYITAIQDRFGNTIQYKYNNNYGTVSKIIDTYGREICFNSISNGKEITYTDENNKTQTIKYETEQLPASELDNDSPIKSKPVSRLSVTNEAGEVTKYDSRETEVINFLHTASTIALTGVPSVYGDPVDISYGSNIERIIYPTGAETRYKYKCIYTTNYNAKVAQGQYAVEESYDLVDGKVKNKKTYDFSTSARAITKTETDVSKSSKTIYSYDKNALLTKSVLSPDGTTSKKPYCVNSYTYNSTDKQLTSHSINNSGVTTTTNYSYKTNYPGSLSSESIGDKKTTYTYHTIDGKLTGMPSITNYQYKSGSSYVTDYSVETTLGDNNAIEYKKVIQSDKIKNQQKYIYDASGRVTSVIEWVSDSNSDGALDESDKTIEMTCSYNDTTNGTVVTESIASLTNADDESIPGISTTYSFNPKGNAYSMTDPNGNTTSITYDGTGRATKYTYANGATETISYNAASKSTRVKEKSGTSYFTYYDGLGNPTTKYFYNNGWVTYENNEYDTSERLSSKRQYSGSGPYTREEYTYDVLDRVVTKIVYSGTSKLYTENYAYSTSGSNTVIEKTIVSEDETELASEKDTYNNLDQLIKKEIGSGSDKMTYEYTYDYKGNVLSETDAKGNVTSYTYNYNNDITQTKYPNGVITANTYDMMNFKRTYLDKNWNVIRYYYDEIGRLIKTYSPMESSARDSIKKNYYDANSNLIKESAKINVPGDNAAEKYTSTVYSYNNMNNLIGVTSNDGNTNSAIQYWYDKAGRITAMSTGLNEVNTNYSSPVKGSITRYEYDVRGYVSKKTDALGQITTYTNDYNGNIKTSTDRNGAITTNAYGPYGITSSTITDGTNTEKYVYTYNKLGWQTESKLYNNGVLKDTITTTYDTFGRKASETNNGRTNSYTYDANSNITAYKLLNGTENEINNSYIYDKVNNLTEANLNGIIVSYQYDDADNLIKKTIGSNVTTISYNDADLPSSYVNKVGNTVVNSYSYTYRGDGNRVTDKDTANNIVKTYQYDDMGRLINETQSGSVNRNTEYTYDLRGNRLSETVSGEESYTVTSTYDANNRLTNQSEAKNGIASKNTNYYYDANGNRIFKQIETYSSSGAAGITGGDIATGTATNYSYKTRRKKLCKKYKNEPPW